MPSDHFQDFDPEVVHTELSPQAQQALLRLSSDDTPPQEPDATQ